MAELRDHLRRFWLVFEPGVSEVPALGCGVSAVSEDDAKELVSTAFFDGDRLPALRQVIEDVDVARLDQRHVVPNMGDVTVRGVWFPHVR